MADLVKNNYNKIKVGNQKPVIGESNLNMEFKGKKIILNIDSLYKSSLNMYFKPHDYLSDYRTNLKSQSISQYVADSVKSCPFDVKERVFKNIVLSGYVTEVSGFKEQFEINMKENAN